MSQGRGFKSASGSQFGSLSEVRRLAAPAGAVH